MFLIVFSSMFTSGTWNDTGMKLKSSQSLCLDFIIANYSTINVWIRIT